MALAASAAFDARGIAESTIRTDQEPAIQALVEQIAEERKTKGFKCQLTNAPKRSHSSMGFIESMNDQGSKQIRVIKLQLEWGVGVRIPVFHRIMAWLVRHAGWLLARFAVRQGTGKTAYQVIRGKQYYGEIATLGEVVWARVPGDRTRKAEAQWRLGVWLGMLPVDREQLQDAPESVEERLVSGRGCMKHEKFLDGVVDVRKSFVLL